MINARTDELSVVVPSGILRRDLRLAFHPSLRVIPLTNYVPCTDDLELHYAQRCRELESRLADKVKMEHEPQGSGLAADDPELEKERRDRQEVQRLLDEEREQTRDLKEQIFLLQDELDQAGQTVEGETQRLLDEEREQTWDLKEQIFLLQDDLDQAREKLEDWQTNVCGT